MPGELELDKQEFQKTIKSLEGDYLSSLKKMSDALRAKEEKFSSMRRGEEAKVRDVEKQLQKLREINLQRDITGKLMEAEMLRQKAVALYMEEQAQQQKLSEDAKGAEEDIHKKRMDDIKEETDERKASLRERFLGEKSVVGRTRRGVQYGTQAQGVGGVSGMAGLAKSGGPWALAIGAIIFALKEVIDTSRNVSAELANVELSMGNVGEASRVMGSKIETTASGVSKKMLDLGAAWADAELYKEITSYARVVGWSTERIVKDFDEIDANVFELSKGFGRLFGTDGPQMMDYFRKNILNFNRDFYDSTETLGKGLEDVTQKLNLLTKTAQPLRRTASEMFNDVRDLNSQFAHMGDQTKNLLVLSKALQETDLPDMFRSDTIKGIIGGFEQMSTGMKMMLGQQMRGGAEGLGGYFRFRQAMRGERRGEGVVEVMRNFQTQIEQFFGPLSKLDLSRVLAGRGGERENAQVVAMLDFVKKQLGVNEEQAISLLQILSRGNKDILKSATSWMKTYNERSKSTGEQIANLGREIHVASKGIVDYLMAKLGAWLKYIALGISKLVKFFTGESMETDEEKQAREEKNRRDKQELAARYTKYGAANVWAPGGLPPVKPKDEEIKGPITIEPQSKETPKIEIKGSMESSSLIRSMDENKVTSNKQVNIPVYISDINASSEIGGDLQRDIERQIGEGILRGVRSKVPTQRSA